MKRPGLVKDPWHVAAPVAPTPRQKTPAQVSQASLRHDDNIDKDIEKKKVATIEGTDDATEAAAMLLRFCVDHSKYTEPLLLNYGILLVQLTNSPVRTPFYIQRADGWTLAIPDVATREIGCLQLVQAVNAMRKDPFLGPKLDLYQIRSYLL
jgi:hypothetical protein